MHTGTDGSSRVTYEYIGETYDATRSINMECAIYLFDSFLHVGGGGGGVMSSTNIPEKGFHSMFYRSSRVCLVIVIRLANL